MFISDKDSHKILAHSLNRLAESFFIRSTAARTVKISSHPHYGRLSNANLLDVTDRQNCDGLKPQNVKRISMNFFSFDRAYEAENEKEWRSSTPCHLKMEIPTYSKCPLDIRLSGSKIHLKALSCLASEIRLEESVRFSKCLLQRFQTPITAKLELPEQFNPQET